LPRINYIDLNLNQIEWEEDEIKPPYKIIRKYREKKMLGDKVRKIRSVDLQLCDKLIIKIMSP
jgi:hypothetical protein